MYTYDALDRLIEVEDALEQTTSFTWNVLSQPMSIAYPTQESLSYTYDAHQRLSQLSASDQRSISFTYDAYDRLSHLSHSATGTHQFSYDALNRVTSVTSPAQKEATFDYDAIGRLIESTWEQEVTQFTYDAASRLTAIEAPGNRSYALSYDAADRLLSEELPSTAEVHYLYDANDRITELLYTAPAMEEQGAYAPRKPSQNEAQAASTEEQSTLARKKIFLAAGEYSRLLVHWHLHQAHLHRQIQAQGGKLKDQAWVTQVRLLNWWRKALLDPVTLASFTPLWDEGDRIIEENIHLGNASHDRFYQYDEDDQLLVAQLPHATYTYTYDERYNRLTQRIEATTTDTTDEYTYNAADQLTLRVRKDTTTQATLEEESFSYNAVGEMVSRTLTIGQNAETTTYAYEVGGNLHQVTLPDQSVHTYSYDALGQRVRKQTPTLDIHYHYHQGACIMEEHRDPITEQVIRTLRYYPWGMSITEGQTTTSYYFISDYRGWVWGLTDDSGLLVETYDYDPFGRLLQGSQLPHARFLSGMQGGQWDAATGLYHLGARYYDPALGRFLQEDAVEGSASLLASQNRYVYCQNDPISLIDPTGYSPENTGTPSRFGQGNPANYSSSQHACIVSPWDGFDAKSGNFDGELAGKSLPGLSMPGWDGCYEVEEITDDKDRADGVRRYRLTINGITVIVLWDERTGIFRAGYTHDDNPTDAERGIVAGLNAAFRQMKKEGFRIHSPTDVMNFLRDIVSFAEDNLGTFASILGGYDTFWTYYQFMKHATIGAVIADNLAKEDHTERGGDTIYKGIYNFYNEKLIEEGFDPRYPRGKVENNFNSYDMEIGFWLSFFNEHLGLGLSIFSAGTNELIGLVDLGNIVKAMIKQESMFEGTVGNRAKRHQVRRSGPNDAIDGWGLMAVGKPQVNELNNMFNLNFNASSFGPSSTNPFTNIGVGIGHLMVKRRYAIDAGEMNRNDNSLENWLIAVMRYNGSGVQAKQYRAVVRERFRRYRGP